MTEDIYAKPDLTKKVKFQKGVKEDRDTDVCDDIDNVRIYDNFWAEESTPPEKSEDNITEDQQPTVSVNVSSGKRNVFGAAAMLLGLLCLLLLVAVIVLVVLYIPERNRLWVENANLTSERDKLRTSYSETKSLNANLTLKMNQFEEEKDHLMATNNNLTEERDELQDRLDGRKCCPNKWTRFGNSCYFTSTSKKNWSDSKKKCIDDDAQLVIISSEEEQEFISSFKQRMWIGLTDEESEDVWKWVDGTPLTKGYWRPRQPDNANTENCVEISMKSISSIQNWNDLPCSHSLYFTCEKILE
ncbi:hypothetical protein VZT92_002436 [Zoarces viviparus]|uniref:C-type lectin domain-containing protein n=1 Tax=Zoarces viviparus TaxID=48416 RepID=A0AAW1FYA1_ZOAVI